jgi:hypothetical protein
VTTHVDDDTAEVEEVNRAWEAAKTVASVLALIWLAERWLFPGMLDFLPIYGDELRSETGASIGDTVSDGELTFVVKDLEGTCRAVGRLIGWNSTTQLSRAESMCAYPVGARDSSTSPTGGNPCCVIG